MTRKTPQRPQPALRKLATATPELREPRAALLAAPLSFLALYRAEPMERVRLVKTGMPAATVEDLSGRMRMSRERLLGALGLARATIDRKAREDKPLSADEGARVLGMARLIGQVQAMVDESGATSASAADFDAAQWLGRWIDEPLPALGGQRPADFLDTAEGQGIVANLLARMQSGAYA